MQRYSIEPRTRQYIKGHGLLSLARKYKKQLLDTGQDAVKTASKKQSNKAGEFIGNKIGDAVTKSNNDKIVKLDENPRNVEKIIIPIDKRDEILNKFRKVI